MSWKPVLVTALGLSLLWHSPSAAEMAVIHQNTTAPADGRFEIVQSQLAARWTFKLDRYSGEVVQLVLNADKSPTWEPVLVQDLPKIKTPLRPRFQIFTSGLAARHTFLLDVLTGMTWLLTLDTVTTKEGESEIIMFKAFK